MSEISTAQALALAHSLLDQRRLDAAVPLVEGLAAALPGRFEAPLALGRLRRHQRRHAEAAAAYSEAVRLAPQRLESRLYLAEALMAGGRGEEALEELQRARASCPPPEADDADALLSRFRLETGSCDFGAAVATAERVLDLTRATNYLEVLRRPQLTREFDFTSAPRAWVDRAFKALDRLVAERPGSPWGWCWHGLLASLHPGRQSDDRADFDRVESFPADRYGWMRFEPALRKLRTGDLAGALSGFEAVNASSEPGNWRACCHMAEARLCQGDLAGAVAEFDRLLGWIPERDAGAALAWKGEALLWVGEYARALATLDAALGRTAHYAHCWRGGALLKLGRPSEALAALDEALKVKPEDDEARVWRAETLLRLGRPEAALEEAGKAASASGGRNPFGLILRALARAALGDAAGMTADAQAVPAAFLDEVRRRTGADESDPVRLLEAALGECRGVRRWGYELRACGLAATPASLCSTGGD